LFVVKRVSLESHCFEFHSSFLQRYEEEPSPSLVGLGVHFTADRSLTERVSFINHRAWYFECGQPYEHHARLQ